MKKYEVTVLIKTGQTSEAKDKFTDKVEKIVKALGGKVGKLTEMGKKQMTYKIGNQIEADFLMFGLELPVEAVVQLKSKLAVDKEILRFLLVKAQG